MKSSDKATLEYLNILNDRGIGAVGMLADSYGVDQGTMYDMISKSEISGTDAAQIILDALSETYGGSMEKQSQTYSGLTSTLEGLTEELENASGEAYNETRKEGLSDQIAAYSGELGEAIQSINAIAGQNQAYLDNLSEQYQREVLSGVLMGDTSGSLLTPEQQEQVGQLATQYSELKEEYANGNQEAGLKMQSIYEEAQALATNYYDSSEALQTVNDNELDEISSIRTSVSDIPSKLDYLISVEESKGSGATLWSAASEAAAAGTETGLALTGGDGYLGNAYGLQRVPYDGYKATLHQGERVLTASQAREADSKESSGGVTITGNTFNVREDADIDKIASALYDKMRVARMGG
jgi:hypothetical protein